MADKLTFKIGSKVSVYDDEDDICYRGIQPPNPAINILVQYDDPYTDELAKSLFLFIRSDTLEAILSSKSSIPIETWHIPLRQHFGSDAVTQQV